MNLILGKSKQEYANLLWEPFATSTPLKVAPNSDKIINELKLLTQTGSVNFVGKDPCTFDNLLGKLTESKNSFPKKGRKNRSSAYFDLSSSSDDDDSVESRRPIIKINSNKKTRSLLKIKKSEDGEAEDKIDQIVGSTLKPKTVTNKNSATSTTVTLKPKKIQGVEKKAKIKSIELNNSIESLHEGSKIFDESKSTNVNRVPEPTSPLNNKENKINDSENEVTINEATNAKHTSKGKINKLPKIVIKSKINNNVPDKEISGSNKILKPLKRRGTSNVITAGPAKKPSTKRTKAKSCTQVSKDTATPLHIWENKRNLSHQLFSDSREQECINTLDLTSEEINEGVENVKYSPWKKPKEIPHEHVNMSHPSNGNEVIKKEEEQNRPNRRKQKPKEFWMPETELDNLNNIDKEKQTKKNLKPSSKKEQKSKQQPCTKSNNQPEFLEEIKENKPESAINPSDLKSPIPLKRGRRKKAKESEKQSEPNVAVVTSMNGNKLKAGETELRSKRKPTSCADSESNKLFLEKATVEQKAIKTDTTVFKQLSELPFKDNGTGCFAAQCWNTNNLKCGVFKLLINSQLTCKTLHNNSHLGGVVVKGTLKMKIGDNVLDLKEGDMAFVPPITEWQATNIGECESIFYYWCGRFNC